MLSFDQFRHAIEQTITELETLPPTPENLAKIAELQTLLDGLPLEENN